MCIKMCHHEFPSLDPLSLRSGVREKGRREGKGGRGGGGEEGGLGRGDWGESGRERLQ